MKSYLEIQVPISPDAPWFQELRINLTNIPVRWQSGFYHITMAFLNDTPLGIDLSPIFRMHLGMATAPVMTFDRLDVFTATYGGYIIYLTASHIPQSFLDLTEAIRKDLKEAGCVIQSDFRLHVTLGRVNGSGVKLREVLHRVPIQPFTLKLTNVDFRVFRGKTLYETKLSQ